jgi:cytoskeletal protein RodZ
MTAPVGKLVLGPPVDVEAGGTRGPEEQAARVPTISAIDTRSRRDTVMGLILLEALLALVILLGIVWWTMFQGRSKGELPPQDEPRDPH